jgi:uncharacterized protein YdeI (YjbR/CyaY-like superfamily)
MTKQAARREPVVRPKLFATVEAWDLWLGKNYDCSTGVWLKIAKRTGGSSSTVSYEQALDVALCHGWIDARKGKLDSRFWLQRFTPRTPTSRWSRINCEKVERMIIEGRMRAAGLKAVEAAKADGRWANAYDGPRRATVPDDLQQALNDRPDALAFFEELDGRNRYAILYRLMNAKQPATRARNLSKFVEMLARRETIHAPKRGRS